MPVPGLAISSRISSTAADRVHMQLTRSVWLKRTLVAVSISLLLSDCASNPTGGANFVLMSEKRELEIGKEEHQKILDSVPIYQDAELQAYVDRIGQKLAALSDRPELTYTFTIIDSPDINAFALPGGYVYVDRKSG